MSFAILFCSFVSSCMTEQCLEFHQIREHDTLMHMYTDTISLLRMKELTY